MNIDKSKLVKYFEHKLKHYAKFKGTIAGVTERSNLIIEILNSINSGEFDCEADRGEEAVFNILEETQSFLYTMSENIPMYMREINSGNISHHRAWFNR